MGWVYIKHKGFFKNDIAEMTIAKKEVPLGDYMKIVV